MKRQQKQEQKQQEQKQQEQKQQQEQQPQCPVYNPSTLMDSTIDTVQPSQQESTVIPTNVTEQTTAEPQAFIAVQQEQSMQRTTVRNSSEDAAAQELQEKIRVLQDVLGESFMSQTELIAFVQVNKDKNISQLIDSLYEWENREG